MYIKREDMRLVIENDRNYGWYLSDGTLIFSKSEVLEMLNAIPSADVVEVKRGKWVNGECSECGGDAPFWPMATTYYRSNFCPNCGARMVEHE